MAVNKHFVVKNGIEVATDLIYAPSDLDKVGVGSTIPTTKIDILGGLAAQDGKFTGITTVVQEFNVGTSNTIFTVKGPRAYPTNYSILQYILKMYYSILHNRIVALVKSWDPTMEFYIVKLQLLGGWGQTFQNDI